MSFRDLGASYSGKFSCENSKLSCILMIGTLFCMYSYLNKKKYNKKPP